jgi:hypothetical protein
MDAPGDPQVASAGERREAGLEGTSRSHRCRTARQNHRVGPTDGARWLAIRPPRQNGSGKAVLHGQKHEIDVSRQPPVLEAIVQHHRPRTQVTRPQSTGTAIGIGDGQAGRSPAFVQCGFVSAIPAQQHGRRNP